MKDLESAKKIAVLIDAENAQYSVLAAVLAELSKHGHIIVKKAYGDWSSMHLKKLETASQRTRNYAGTAVFLYTGQEFFRRGNDY